MALDRRVPGANDPADGKRGTRLDGGAWAGGQGVSASNGDDGPPVRLRVPARAENVFVVRQALTGLGQALGVERSVLDDIKIAVTEACTNVVVHAYRDGEGLLEVEAWPDGHRLLVVVRDHGPGVAPRADRASAGLGLGLPLMATLSEEMLITTGADGANEVHMTFALAAADEAGPDAGA
jgi:anti-sigma regulatory factor (Ser/Thr protein kinase)